MFSSKDPLCTTGLPLGIVHGDLWTHNLLFKFVVYFSRKVWIKAFAQNRQRRQVHRRITGYDRLADDTRGQSYGGFVSTTHLEVQQLNVLLLDGEFLLSVAPLHFDAWKRTIYWSITMNNAQEIMTVRYRSTWQLYTKCTTLHFHLAWSFTRKACLLQSIVRPWSAKKICAKDFTKEFVSPAIAGHPQRAERRRELLQRVKNVMEDCASEEIRQCFEETMKKVLN